MKASPIWPTTTRGVLVLVNEYRRCTLGENKWSGCLLSGLKDGCCSTALCTCLFRACAAANWLQESGWVAFSRLFDWNYAKLTGVSCLVPCAGTLFGLLLKFGAVLIIGCCFFFYGCLLVETQTAIFLLFFFKVDVIFLPLRVYTLQVRGPSTLTFTDFLQNSRSGFRNNPSFALTPRRCIFGVQCCRLGHVHMKYACRPLYHWSFHCTWYTMARADPLTYNRKLSWPNDRFSLKPEAVDAESADSATLFVGLNHHSCCTAYSSEIWKTGLTGSRCGEKERAMFVYQHMASFTPHWMQLHYHFHPHTFLTIAMLILPPYVMLALSFISLPREMKACTLQFYFYAP